MTEKKKNLKDLTLTEWEKYTSEVAQNQFEHFGREYNENEIPMKKYHHPELDNYLLDESNDNINKWIDTIKTKYSELRLDTTKRKIDGFQTIEDLKKIKTPQDIKSFIILKRYEDDHLLCAIVFINGIKIEFLYYDELGFLKYWHDSPSAFNDLLKSLQYEINVLLEYNKEL